MVIKNNKIAAQGIGTLIIFIALILVAAVAAGVLIQTSASLQSKTLNVASQTEEQLTTGLDVSQIYARDTSDGVINGSGNDNFTVVVRLGSGASAVKLNDIVIKIDDESGTQTLNFGTSASNTSFSATYLSNNGAAKTNGYVSVGDLVALEFHNLNEMVESEDIIFHVYSVKGGGVKPIDLTTPSSMTKTTTYLFP